MIEAKRVEIKSAKLMKEVMENYFHELDDAARDKNKKVAWCSSVGPAELAQSMGYKVYFYENHAAMIGTNRTAMDFIPVANAHGYSPDICSYLTSDIGAYLKGETPLKVFGIQTVPRPDVLLYNTNQCRDVYDWMNFYSHEFNVPLLGVATPRTQHVPREDTIKSVEAQIREMIPELERISGTKFDIDRFRETMRLSLECTTLWQKVLDTSMHKPSPINFFDTCVHMGPAVVLRGTQVAIDYYKVLLAEMEERIRDGISAVPGEKHRFYWEGMPIWGKLRMMSELFSRLKACIVVSTYCNSWVFPQFDPKEPFYSMAKAYCSIFIGQDDIFKENYMADKVDKYGVDGIIFHDAKTCPNNTNNRYGMANRVSERLGVPHLVINGDLNDLRCLSEEQTITNVEAFVEQIEEK
jgi:benzoyl-CoA reductase/2-hydroxyglutaryl-CoA dehydratase subunit BcrC/BadD/HgdB